MNPKEEELYREGLKDDFAVDEGEWWAIHHKKLEKKKTPFVKIARTEGRTRVIEA